MPASAGDGSQIYNVSVNAPLTLSGTNSFLLEAPGGVVNSANSEPGDTSTGYYAKAFHGYVTAIGNYANIGGWFGAAGDRGVGVYGVGSSETAGSRNYGGYFEARAGQGRGVYAEAKGANGRGVEGVASRTGSYGNYGGYFSAAGNSGVGVYASTAGNNFAAAVKGEATNTSVSAVTYGGHFKVRSGAGIGVYGEATSTDGTANYGGQFSAAGSQAKAVYGAATSSTTGSTWGGYFVSYAGSGIGAEGYAEGATGTGIAGYSAGAGGVGVHGWATNGGDVDAKGGKFISQGLRGIGAWGSGNGYDFYAAGSGVNYGPFTGGHEVRLDPGFPEDAKPGLIVAATESVDWSTVEENVEHGGRLYKIHLLAVVYVSG